MKKNRKKMTGTRDQGGSFLLRHLSVSLTLSVGDVEQHRLPSDIGSTKLEPGEEIGQSRVYENSLAFSLARM